MRPSVVARGLKSLVDKLNPGMPLTSEESSRLLTALTSSFRKQLDEAHPQSAEPSPSTKIGSRRSVAPRNGPGSLHSSAAAADHHLSSVLTSPLFNPGISASNLAPEDAAQSSATDHVIRQSGVDAIASFKSATAVRDVPLKSVELCMTTFHDALWSLADDTERRLLVQKHKPGQTILAWLIKHERYSTRVLSESRQFASRLVGYLLCEGREDVVWSWLAVEDLRTVATTPDDGSVKSHVARPQHWRGWLLSYMLDAQLRPPSRQGFNITASADTAIDTFLEALKQRQEVRRSGSRAPLGTLTFRQPATVIAHYLFYNHENGVFSRTASRKYDEFLKAIDERVGDFSDNQLRVAMCHMAHPQRPDASIGLRLLDKITNPQTADDETFAQSLALLDKTRRRDWCHLLLRCIAVVGTTLTETETNLLYARLKKLFPEKISLISQEMRRSRRLEEEDARPVVPAAHDLSKFSFG